MTASKPEFIRAESLRAGDIIILEGKSRTVEAVTPLICAMCDCDGSVAKREACHRERVMLYTVTPAGVFLNVGMEVSALVQIERRAFA